MPTYEYNCGKCGIFECRQSFNDATLERCPTCGGPVKRIISRNVNVIYKTSGFYVSDHRSTDYRSRADKDGGGSGDTGSKSSTASAGSSSSTDSTGSAGKTTEKSPAPSSDKR